MLCAEAGQSGFRMVFGLVSAGCDISAVDKIGMTALHYACYVGAVPTVRFLLEEALEFSDKKACDILNLQVSVFTVVRGVFAISSKFWFDSRPFLSPPPPGSFRADAHLPCNVSRSYSSCGLPSHLQRRYPHPK